MNQYNQEAALLRIFNVLRFPLCVLVVFIHTKKNSMNIDSVNWLNLANIDIAHVITIVISDIIGNVAVPTFFVISGFLYFNRTTKWEFSLYRIKSLKRLASLAVPYVCWNLIALLAWGGREYVISTQSGTSFTYFHWLFDWNEWYHFFWEEPVNYPLWFIRDLIFVSFLSPFIYYFIRFFRLYGILALILIYLSSWKTNILGLSDIAILFFTCGAYLSLFPSHLFKLVPFFRRSMGLFLVLFCVLLMIYIMYPYPFVMNLFILVGVVTFLDMGSKIADGSMAFYCLKGAPATFFIYAAHSILLIDFVRASLNRIFYLDSPFSLLTVYFLTPMLTVLWCGLIYVFLSKFFFNVLNFLEGGRLKKRLIIKSYE